VLGDWTISQRSDYERARGEPDAMGLSDTVCIAGMELYATLPATEVSIEL
jgi:hypothetical protein